MTFSDLVLKRRSVRKFLERPVERKAIETCLEAARLAPSANNVQPWRFLVVDDTELRQALAEVAFSGIYKVTRFAARAPVLILILARRGNVADAVGNVLQATDFHLLDIGIAGEHLALAATERGLGTCWIGWFNKKRVRKLLCIPRRFDLVAMMALGYPDPTELAPKRKKKLSDIVRYNRFDWDS